MQNMYFKIDIGDRITVSDSGTIIDTYIVEKTNLSKAMNFKENLDRGLQVELEGEDIVRTFLKVPNFVYWHGYYEKVPVKEERYVYVKQARVK